MMKKSKAEEVFVRQTKPDHTLGASIAISIMSGGWALGGLSIWRREETSMGAGGWPKSHHPADCGPLESQWLLLLSGSCDQQPRLDNGWALQAPRMATSWAVTRAHGGLTRLGAG